jgi:uncharacterized small protein (DUF1192 family)
MAVGLVGVSWIAVKAGLALNDLSKTVNDPVGAAEDAARGTWLLAKRTELANSEQVLRDTATQFDLIDVEDFLSGVLGGSTLKQRIAEQRAEVARLEAEIRAVEAEQKVSDDVQDAPGISLLRTLDTYLVKYGPVAPAGITGSMILMEMLRVKRERERI